MMKLKISGRWHYFMKPNQAIHRMPNPPLRSGFVTGDGGVSKTVAI